MSGAEAVIERAVCRYAEELNCLVLKFRAVGVRGVPDRLFLPVNRRPFFIEFKAPGGVVSSAQYRMHAKLRAHGHSVYIVSDALIGKRLVRALTRGPAC